MIYPGRKNRFRTNEKFVQPAPAWAQYDLKEWLERNVTDPQIRSWYLQSLNNTPVNQRT